jgi:hypothetical protein
MKEGDKALPTEESADERRKRVDRERKRLARKDKRARGLRPYEIWVTEAEWRRVKRYIGRLEAKR